MLNVGARFPLFAVVFTWVALAVPQGLLMNAAHANGPNPVFPAPHPTLVPVPHPTITSLPHPVPTIHPTPTPMPTITSIPHPLPTVVIPIDNSNNAPVDVVLPNPSPTNTNCSTENPQLLECQQKPDCRKYHKEGCGSFLKNELEKQTNAVLGKQQTTVVPDVNGFYKRGQKGKARVVRGINKTVLSQGANSTLRLAQVPAAIGRFRKSVGVMLSPDQLAAIAQRTRWAGQAGYESCAEYAFEAFPALSQIEDWIAENPGDPVKVANNIVNNHMDQLNPFIPGQPDLGVLEIGKAPATDEERPWIHKIGDGPDVPVSGVEWRLHAFQARWTEINWTPPLKNGESPYVFEGSAYSNLNSLVKSLKTTPLDVKSQLTNVALMDVFGYAPEYMEEARRIEEHFQDLVDSQNQIQAAYGQALFDHGSDWRCKPSTPPIAGGGQSACNTALAQDEVSRKVALNAIQPLKALMNDLMIKANNLGCFTTYQACAWSPTLMKNSFTWALYKFRARREALQKICSLVVHEAGTTPAQYNMVPNDDYQWIVQNNGLNPGTWKNDPNSFQTFFDKAIAYYKQVQIEKQKIKEAAQVTDPATGKKQLGALFADTGYVGTALMGKKIGGGYEYSTQWMTSDYNTKICQADVSNQLTFALYGDVLGSRVVDVRYNGSFATQLSGAHSTVTMTYNGTQLVAPYDQGTATAPYHFFANPNTRKNALELSQTIIAFGVPVTLSLGAFAEAGHVVDINTQVSRMCDSTSIGDMNVKETGKMGPYARVALDASAAVDVGIADIGVRGEMTLVRLGLPLTISNTLGKRYPDLQESLQADSSLGLEIGTLGGSLSVFFDSIFGGSEATLVSWAGLSQTTVLQENKVNFSLKYAREALSSP